MSPHISKMTLSSLPLSLIFLVLSGANALQVTPGSSCSDVCQSSLSTNSSEIVCDDVDYYSSSNGATFKDCIQCLQSSNATSESENDVSWFLYNLRYASAVCLYDFPKHRENSTSSCDLEYACAPLQGALEYGNLDSSNETEYGYCQADNNAFYGTAIDDCVSCLQSSSSAYMANFILALESGCQQEPAAGQVLSISGNIFSDSAVNITVPNNSTSSSSSSSSNHDTALSTNAIIGIAIGLGVMTLTAFGLFIYYCCRQRRQASWNDNNPYGPNPQYYYPKDPGSAPTSITTAQNYALANYTVDYKSQLSGPTISETPEPAEPGDFSSNAEYYDRLEGLSRGRPLKSLPLRMHPTTASISDGTETDHGPSPSALPTHPAYIPRSQMPGQLGGRASRNVTSQSLRSSSSVSSRQEWRRSNKPDPYAIQVYLSSTEDPKFPGPPPPVMSSSTETARNIQVQLTGPPVPYEAQGPLLLQQPPPSLPASGRGTPVPAPPPPPQDRRGTPAPPQFKTVMAADSRNNNRGAGERPPAPRIQSLILPSVPRIRVPGWKQSRARTDEPAPMGISGPLAFPDSRFSARPVQDRIIEQTADRGGQFMEVPIGSGKSYLYG